MSYVEVKSCRICGNTNLEPILDLGMQALTGVFPRSPATKVPVGPLALVKCEERRHSTRPSEGGCGLVQLRHSHDPGEMYGENYGYRSGLNQSMVRHLAHRVARAVEIASPRAGDTILDIGSNDGTTLSQYPSQGLELIGMDPTSTKFARYHPPHMRAVADFFSAERFTREVGGRKAKVVTSIAMFYDLDDPLSFMKQVRQVLADDGIWVFEQSYLLSMLTQNAYDTVCHEHLSYYAVRQIHWMTQRAGLKIIDVEVNDINGGSFCITVAKDTSAYAAADNRVAELLAVEEKTGLGGLAPFEEFRQRVFRHRDQLTALVRGLRADGKSVYGYGASTKGNVLLQFCGFTTDDIPAVAEVNEDKFGAFTPQTLIPIRSEADVRALRPDYLLVLPWHFRAGIVKREAPFLDAGGRLIFPLPEIETVDRTSSAAPAR